MDDAFRKFSHRVADIVGGFRAFSVAFILIVVWLISGPFLNFSTIWQLIINTSTTIITFLMVFIIQNTQNRDTKALNLKLDELIRSVKQANNSMLDVEDLSDKELMELEEKFKKIGQKKH